MTPNLYAFVAVLEHETMYEDRLFVRFMCRADSQTIAEEMAKTYIEHFKTSHKLEEYVTKDMAIIEENFCSTGDFLIY